jgi:hypothetical protein
MLKAFSSYQITAKSWCLLVPVLRLKLNILNTLTRPSASLVILRHGTGWQAAARMHTAA